MKTRRIVITGGPGSGKTSLITHLENEGYDCMHEISRELIIDAKKEGIEQVFLEDPVTFSKSLLERRLQQFDDGLIFKTPFLFYDRGLPDISAYLDYINSDYPSFFEDIINRNRYDLIFILPPWKAIYKNDNERYESFKQAKLLHQYLMKSYKKYKYPIVKVPTGDIHERSFFIINHLEQLY